MSAINRSLLASAAASVASTRSTASTASATSKKGALSSPEGVSLDAYVRRAWSSVNNDVVSVAPEAFAFGHRADKNKDTEAGDEATVTFVADVDVEVRMDAGIKADGQVVTEATLESDDRENINAGSDADKDALPNSIEVLFERYVPKAPELKLPTADAERPFEDIEPNAAVTDRADDGVQILPLPLPLMPLQVLIPPHPENIKMGLQVGKGFSKTPSVGASAVPQADVPARASRAGLDAIPRFSNGVKLTSKKPPAVETVSAAMSTAVAVQIPKFDKIDAKPTSLDADMMYGDVAISTDAPQKPAQTPAQKPTQTSTQTDTQTKVSTPTSIPTQTPIQTPIQTSIQTPVPTPTPTQKIATHSADIPSKEKSLPHMTPDAPDAPAQPLPLIQAMQEQTATATPNSAASSSDSTRHSPQPGQQPARQPATASTASTDAAVSATTGSTLTYRFDKWNGNHAVTVHAPLHADHADHAEGRSRELEPAGRNTAPQAVQNAEIKINAQYSLSPSDDLVSQRLNEHLARTADAQDTPSMRLTDSDERQRRQGQEQGQSQQEDEEDET